MKVERTITIPIVPKNKLDTGAGSLLEELFISSMLENHPEWTGYPALRRTANGTMCPKHRRNWYLKSRGMPTGF